MVAVLLLLFLQLPIERRILEVEDARSQDVSVLLEALKHLERRVQMLAVRALGRLERPQYADPVRAVLATGDGEVRMQAVNALGQMKAAVDFRPLLEAERSGAVRGVIYATAGRHAEHTPEV